MSGHAGLTKVTKNVKGKKGMVRRSYWVRGTDAVKSGAKKLGSFANRHKGKIAAAAALAGAAYLGHKHRGALSSAVERARAAHEAGKKRAGKFNKAAQQAEWGRRATVEHTVKGYAQGSGLRDAANAAYESAKRAPGAARSAASSAAASISGRIRSARERMRKR